LRGVGRAENNNRVHERTLGWSLGHYVKDPGSGAHRDGECSVNHSRGRIECSPCCGISLLGGVNRLGFYLRYRYALRNVGRLFDLSDLTTNYSIRLHVRNPFLCRFSLSSYCTNCPTRDHRQSLHIAGFTSRLDHPSTNAGIMIQVSTRISIGISSNCIHHPSSSNISTSCCEILLFQIGLPQQRAHRTNILQLNSAPNSVDGSKTAENSVT
jgi:hypothetical protein